MEDRSPALGKRAFACPYCGAFTQQVWFDVFASESDNVRPLLPDFIEDLVRAELAKSNGDASLFEETLKHVQEKLPGISSENTDHYARCVFNCHFSRCFVCAKEAIWVGSLLVYPRRDFALPEPNADLPPGIRADYEEAGAVLAQSPRAAAALLRLAIQKLCSLLLERPGDINEMTKDLVAQGLSPKIQQALDVVRVVGNEAVHPGTLDLRDDHETASRLFMLVNLIADAMITQPKHIQELYASLPASKLKGIEERDATSKKDAG